MKEITTIQFTDVDSNSKALMIVRAREGVIGLALSLLDDGDVEVFFGVAECRRVVQALEEATSIAEGLDQS